MSDASGGVHAHTHTRARARTLTQSRVMHVGPILLVLKLGAGQHPVALKHERLLQELGAPLDRPFGSCHAAQIPRAV